MRCALPVLLLLLATACGDDPTAQGSRVPAPAATAVAPKTPKATAPDGTEALASLVRRLLAAATGGREEEAVAISRALLLPDERAFFAAAFGPQIGERVQAEYRPNRDRIDTLPALFRKLADEGQTEVFVERFEQADDPGATGYQGVALRALKRPTALYSVRFLRPGEKVGYHLWSFVFADGAFRFADKMRSVDPRERSAETAALGELRQGEAKRFLETGSFDED